MTQDRFPKTDTELTKNEPNLNLPTPQPLPRDITSSDGINRQEALRHAFLYPSNKVVNALTSDSDAGLSDPEIKRRQEEFGANTLQGGDDISKWKILLHQVANAMTLGEY